MRVDPADSFICVCACECIEDVLLLWRKGLSFSNIGVKKSVFMFHHCAKCGDYRILVEPR
jgi:hypothetical protein